MQNNQPPASAAGDSNSFEEQQLAFLNHPLLVYILRAINNVTGDPESFRPPPEVLKEHDASTEMTDFILQYLRLLELQAKEVDNLVARAADFCEYTAKSLPALRKNDPNVTRLASASGPSTTSGLCPSPSSSNTAGTAQMSQPSAEHTSSHSSSHVTEISPMLATQGAQMPSATQGAQMMPASQPSPVAMMTQFSHGPYPPNVYYPPTSHYMHSSNMGAPAPQTAMHYYPMYQQATGLPQQYQQATGLPQQYQQATGLPQQHQQATGLPQQHQQATGLPQQYQQATGLPQQHQQATGLPQQYQQATGLPQQYQQATGLPQQRKERIAVTSELETEHSSGSQKPTSGSQKSTSESQKPTSEGQKPNSGQFSEKGSDHSADNSADNSPNNSPDNSPDNSSDSAA